MDAKPQRPLRAVRVRTDENLPPLDHVVGKTIHQRNKSSPALSMAANMQKAGTKRAAFGDLSNVSQQVRPSKDDSSLPTKPASQLQSKPVLPLSQQPLHKPAQRPMSVSNLRGLITGNPSASHPVSIDTVALQQGSSQPANSRKVLTKRNTTVFKDAVVPLATVQEQDVSQKPLPPTSQHDSASNLQGISLPEILPETLLPAPGQQSCISKDPVKEPAHPLSDSSLPGIEAVSLASEQISAPLDYGEAAVDPIKREIAQSTGDAVQHLPATNNASLAQPAKNHPTSFPSTKVSIASIPLPPFEPKSFSYPAVTEVEECWEEEETPVEEEGYVTARSFRSKGENTTGGATTIIFPHVNQRIRKEIKAATELVEATRNPEEVDDEMYDTSMVAEYGDEIFEYMREMEVKMLPNAHYMDNQHEIQWSMRSVLMDWLIQVHHRFNLLPETLFLTVNYIDRFLSCKIVSLGKLQLVGATAIFIASKYEEINCPSIQEIVYMVDNGYSVDELLKAERFMLTMLHFELGWPGPMSFLRRISKADDYDLETRTLAKYFLEVTIMDERFIGSPPSFTAAASHCLARLMLRKGDWTAHHVHYSGYTFSQLRPLLSLLIECCVAPRSHHAAVFNKYCDKRFKRAASFVEVEMSKGFALHEVAQPKIMPPPIMQKFYDSVSYFPG
ncbi:G2/mitotic-specific cyclin-4 [Cyphellophora attinorum]|uniref:G2/mitotic-specific cyclin-4 n=1 Tax=Cyphellophora attinorum TaxID=1664694 RepID=A0A0N0NKY6_9EURO|nr:G2/mitotic-specific cyclin-4 [Phialophora attinorum]KPI38399.1 G2/mitotic-specific cyclin-4 [Phialophora attinorum]